MLFFILNLYIQIIENIIPITTNILSNPIIISSFFGGASALTVTISGGLWSYWRTKFSLGKDFKVYNAELKTHYTEYKSDLESTKKDIEIETQKAETFSKNCTEKIDGLGIQIEIMSEVIKITGEKITKIDKEQNKLIKSVSIMQLNIENKQEFKKKLLSVQNEGLLYYDSKKDQDILTFAAYKSNNFIDYILEMRELDFNKIEDFHIFLNKGKTAAETVRLYGNQILGKKFITKYYKLHIKETNIFFDSVKEIFLDKLNRKQHNFETESCRFIRKFLSILYKVYCQNQDLIKNNDIANDTANDTVNL